MRRSFVLALALILPLGAASVGRSDEKKIDSDDVSLAGVVTQPSGSPAGTAEVWLVTASMRGEPLVYDHARTDADGKFRLMLPARWTNANESMRQELGMVAWQEGHAPAAICYWRTSTPNAITTRIELKPLGDASLRALSPDGSAVPGAKVTATALICDALRTDLTASRLTAEMKAALKATPNGPALGLTSMLLPRELSGRLQAKTDRDGNVTIPGIALDDVAQLKIETEDFGTQIAQLQIDINDYHTKPKMPGAVALRPVGRVAGQLTATTPGDARGVRIRMTSALVAARPSASGEVSLVGLAEVAVDENGEFEVPALAEGALGLFATLPGDSPLRPRLPPFRTKQVKAAEVTQLEIPLMPGIRATGLVRVRTSKQPLPGIVVQVYGEMGQPVEAVTDKNGRYSCLLPPGENIVLPLTPSTCAPPSQDILRNFIVRIPAEAKTFELPTIELAVSPTLVGQVIDDQDKPVKGAKVRAFGPGLRRGGPYHQRIVELTTDDNGAFRLAVADPDPELLLEVRTGDAFGRLRVTPKTLDGKNVTLRIRSADLIALSGRVVDTSGKPVADVPVELWIMPVTPEGLGSMFERMTFSDDLEIRTDADGRFKTPRELDRESVYQARVALPGGEPAATPGFSAVAGSTEMPELVVRRTTTLAGRVEDRRGQPIVEAVVFQSGDAWKRVQAATDAEGRFRLPDFMTDPTFVFVRKPGFRFFGQRIEAGEDAVVLTLTDTHEPTEPLTTMPPALPRDKRVALARRLLEPCLAKVDPNNEREGPRLFEAWARVDPADMLARLDKTPPKNPFFAGYLRRAAAQALAIEDPDEALALIETIDDTDFRSMAYLDVVDALPDDQGPRKLELLGQAAVVVRQMPEPAMRVFQMGQTAERFLDLGQRGEAEKLLREGETLAKELPLDAFGGYTRGAFAEELGQIDLPAALELMTGLSEVREFDRHHGNLAHELAGTQPPEAERLLGVLHAAKESNVADEPCEFYGVRVCYRMAPVDLSRARAIADRMSNRYLQARAYGVMAQAISKQNPKAAADLIARAFEVLQSLVDAREAAEIGTTGRAAHDWFAGHHSAASVAGALLPSVEAVDPALVREYLWRAVSFRMPRVGDEQQLPLADRANAALAMMIARYDRDTAAAILRPIEARLAGFRSRDTTLATLMLTDPLRAVETVERFDRDQADLLNRAQLAALLALEGDALWRKLLEMTALWSIDVEDL